IDKNGRLFLVYFYYANKLTDAEFADYTAKWPDENVTNDVLNPHDPVILMSSDGGDSWKITTTQDFISGWLRLASNKPEWSDEGGCNDVSNYSTIQTAVVNNELFL